MTTKESMHGETVLVYQKFSGKNEPVSPFKAIIKKEFLSRYEIYYYGTDNTLITRSVLKACCSTKPVKKLKVPEPKKRKRVKLKKKIKRMKLNL